MKNYSVLLFLFFTLRVFSQFEEEDNRILNQYIVMMKPEQKVKDLLRSFSGLTIKACLSQRMNIWLLEQNKTANSEALLSLLQRNPSIKLAQFNHSGIKERNLIPNDPDFNQQWSLQNTGSNGGTTGADIEATEAWNINHGNVTVDGDTLVVAVIDGKPDLSHEDLHFFTNYNEVPGNGIDDDGNGYIDDVNGWNVGDTSGNIGGTNSHATHLAGIVGAKTDNHTGIAGVCWGVKILPVAYGNTIESNVVAAYNYVREMRILYDNTFGSKGAYVVATNSSFGIDGGPFGAHHADYPIWCAMYDSMGAVGILSAAATANKGWDIDANDDIPTGCPSKWLIAVTNTTKTDTRNTGAAFGKESVDLGAPGTGVYSTLPANTYGNMTGTSMATPHVAGTIAAMYAAACKGLIDFYYEQPDSVALLIKEYLLNGAEWISSLNHSTVTNGRLNLYRAFRNLERFNCDSCSFNASILKSPITCYGANDGALAADVSGSVNDYSFLWSNGWNTPEGVSAAPGFYSVDITDSSGCRRTWTEELHNPDTIIISSINTIPALGGNPGNITVIATAGKDSLSYSLDGITYQSTPTFSINANGSFTVFVKNEEGCVVQQQVVVNALNEIHSSAFEAIVYPNPATYQLNVEVNFEEITIVSLCISNSIGQKVWRGEQVFTNGNHVYSIPLSNLAGGIYFLQITSGKLNMTRKFTLHQL